VIELTILVAVVSLTLGWALASWMAGRAQRAANAYLERALSRHLVRYRVDYARLPRPTSTKPARRPSLRKAA
jgi:hypothetical protein